MGWDNGVGEILIQQIIFGKKTATCGFKVEYTEPELKDEYETKNKIVTVMDDKQNSRCNIRVLDVFETTLVIRTHVLYLAKEMVKILKNFKQIIKLLGKIQ